MNLQQLIDEKIALTEKLIEENNTITAVWFNIDNINPEELIKFSKDKKMEYSADGNRLQLHYTNTSNAVIFIYSTPVKINTQISYELI